MEKIRVGIVGCGMITQTRHAPEYAANPNVEIVGVYDIDEKRRKEFSMLYHCKAFATAEELLTDKGIDAVSVCSPNHTHASYSVMAMKSGKHVLCEKPIALNIEDSREMMQVAEETGKILMVGLNQRLLPTHRKAKEVLDSGAIGKIITFQTNFKHSGPENWSINRSNSTWFFDKSKAFFGVLGDLGAHKLDIIRYLLGQEVEKINATIMTLDKKCPDGSPIGVEDNATCTFKMQDGLPGMMTVSWINYGEEDNSTIIYGDKGVMKVFGDYSEDIVLEMRDGSTVKYLVGKISTNTNQLASGIINEFVNSIKENRQPIVTGIDGHNTLAVIASAFESSALGQWVRVKY